MITSASNDRVKNIAALLKKSRLRNERNVFVTEGEKMFLEAPDSMILEVYREVSASLDTKTVEKWNRLQASGSVICEEVSASVFDKMSDTKTPQGILCVMSQVHYSLEDMINGEKPLLLFLENLQDPGNLGTIMRTAEGAGADGIVMTRNTVDIYNPKTIRATMGSIYRVPFLYIEEMHSVIGMVKEKKVKVYAAHLRGQADFTDADYKEGTMFLIGNEGNGLSEECAQLADEYVRIPMQGQLESLNAAVATALFLYEANRQRK